MNNDPEHTNKPDDAKSVSDRVLGKIRTQELSMRPRAYFIIQTAALTFVALIALIASISIGAYILFSIRASSETALLGFGPPGFVIFLQLFPWPLFILGILCIALLEWMLRRFRFGYRSPLLYLLFVILVVSGSIAVALDQSRASDHFLEGAHDHGIPGIGNLYQQGQRPPPPGSGACPCTITAINPGSLSAEENLPDGTHQEVTIILPPQIATSTVQVGMSYFIVGHSQNGILTAFDIKPLQQDGQPPQAHQQQAPPSSL